MGGDKKSKGKRRWGKEGKGREGNGGRVAGDDSQRHSQSQAIGVHVGESDRLVEDMRRWQFHNYKLALS